MRLSGRVVIAALSLAALCASARAMAQESVEEEARAQFDAGVALFDKGELAKASVAFARAYELRPSYKILYLVGKCENAQEHYAASLDAYTRYLAEGGDQIDGARQDEVRGEIKRLDALVGMIVVEADAKGAAVFVDDERKGETPLASPVFVDLGRHTVVVKKGTEELHREIVKVAGGQRVVVKIAVAERGGGEAAAAAPVPAPEVDSKAAPPVEAPKRVWTWVAIGVGGAAAVAAAVVGGLTVSKTNDVKDQCDGNDCPPSSKDDLDAAKALGNATTALIAVAGVGVAAGVVLFFVEPKWRRDERAVEVAPVAAPTADGGALALVGRF